MMTSEFNDNEEDPGNQVAQQLSHFEHAAEFQLLLAQLLDEQSGNYDKSYTRIQQIVRFTLYTLRSGTRKISYEQLNS
jgi:hypothetical protein